MANRWRDEGRYDQDNRGDYRRDTRPGYRGNDEARDDDGSGLRYGEMSMSERYRGSEASTYRGSSNERDYDDYVRTPYERGNYWEDRQRQSSAYGANDDWQSSQRYRNDRATTGGQYERSRADYGPGGRSFGDGGFPSRNYGRDGYNARYSRDNERGFAERAGDEVRSWFGDDEASRRREQDEHRGRGPKNYTRSDERIREDVCDRLSDDPRIDASDIDVQVSGGEVTLSGTVRDRDLKRRAEDTAEDISGVKNVQNNLRVNNDRDYSGSSGQLGTGRSASGTSTLGGKSG
jgi:osmotically-inducible protein OsmY